MRNGAEKRKTSGKSMKNTANEREKSLNFDIVKSSFCVFLVLFSEGERRGRLEKTRCVVLAVVLKEVLKEADFGGKNIKRWG